MSSLAVRAAVLSLFLFLTADQSQARPGGGGGARGGGRSAPSVRGGGTSGAGNFRGGESFRNVQPQAGNRSLDGAGRNDLEHSNVDRLKLNSAGTGPRDRNELPSPHDAKPVDRQHATQKVDNTRRENVEHSPAFTPAWYAQHPQAWQFTHPHADAWVATSFATAAAWLGWNAIQPVAGYTQSEAYNPESDTVVPPASDANLPPAGAGPPDGASDDWLPLGVYALVRPGQAQGTSLLQLAINKEGAVRGTYYDEISDASHILQGSVNSQTQMIDWTVGESGKVTFQAGLDDLTQTSAPVALQFASGRTTYATLVRQTASGQK